MIAAQQAHRGEIAGLGPVALTNHPAMRGAVTLAASPRKEVNNMYVTVLAARPLALRRPTAIGRMTGDDDEFDIDGIPRPRTAVIEGARAEYGALAQRGHSKPTQSELDFVNAALQQHALGPLTEEEILRLDIGTIDPRLSEGEIEVGDRAAFAASTALRREFGDADVYVAYQRAKRRGCVGIVCRSAMAATASATSKNRVFDEGVERRRFATDPALQAEFGEVGVFVAFRRAEVGGQVRIFGQ